MADLQQLIEEGILTVQEGYEDAVRENLKTGEIIKERIYRRRYRDSRSFIKTFIPFIAKVLTDFEGHPKVQGVFILFALIAKAPGRSTVDMSYKKIAEIIESHGMKMWTRQQLSQVIKWLVSRNYIAKTDGGLYSIELRYLYNGSLTKAMGLDKKFIDDLKANKSTFFKVDVSDIVDEEV